MRRLDASKDAAELAMHNRLIAQAVTLVQARSRASDTPPDHHFGVYEGPAFQVICYRHDERFELIVTHSDELVLEAR